MTTQTFRSPRPCRSPASPTPTMVAVDQQPQPGLSSRRRGPHPGVRGWVGRGSSPEKKALPPARHLRPAGMSPGLLFRHGSDGTPILRLTPLTLILLSESSIFSPQLQGGMMSSLTSKQATSKCQSADFVHVVGFWLRFILGGVLHNPPSFSEGGGVGKQLHPQNLSLSQVSICSGPDSPSWWVGELRPHFNSH